eukprot:scaffold25784_cov152-Cylindrotheca_fusiformis.AAC.2
MGEGEGTLAMSTNASNSVERNKLSSLTDSLTWASQQYNDKKKDDSNCDEVNSKDSEAPVIALYQDTLDDEQRRKIVILSKTLSSLAVPSSRESTEARVSEPKQPANPMLSLQRTITDYICGDSHVSSHESRARTLTVLRQRVPEATNLLSTVLFATIQAKETHQKVAVESAFAISSFLEQKISKEDRQLIIKSIGATASKLISVLGTASMTLSFALKGDDPIECLYKLAAESTILQRKMVKRRYTILVTARRLSSMDHWTRIGALDFCRSLFADRESVEHLSCVGQGKNMDILVDGLTKLVSHEDVVQNQLTAVSILAQILELDYQVDKVLQCLRWLAIQSKSRDAILASTRAYCQYLKRCKKIDIKHLKAAVAFIGLSQKEVRHEALVTVELLMGGSTTTGLVTDSDLIERCHQIILKGAEQDRTIAFDILRQAARLRSCHVHLCNHPAFLETVVQFVAGQEVQHPFATEILLALLMNGESTDVFQRMSDLLPWLINFVYSADFDDATKEQLGGVIVRLVLVS